MNALLKNLDIPLGRVRLTQAVINFLLVGNPEVVLTAPAFDAPHRDWQPVPDTVYLQEDGRKVPSKVPLTSVAVYEGKVFAGTSAGLLELSGDELVEMPAMRKPVNRLVTASGGLWVLTSDSLVRFLNGEWKTISEQPVNDLCAHAGEIIAARDKHLWRVRGDTLEPWLTGEAPFPIARIMSFEETLYLMGAVQLIWVNGGEFGGKDIYDSHTDQFWDWGELPSKTIRDLLSLGNRLFIATDRGLGVLRGMALTTLRGEQGLCYEDATCLARGFTNDLWIGTTRGAIRMTGGQFHYFAGQRWLPDDRVESIAAGEQAVYLATPKGLGIIQYEPFTLRKKADYYERHLEEWGHKSLGLVHKLEWDDALQEFVREAGDNDGGYSGDYLAAQSYRYAVTKDPQARREAVNTFQALRWLRTMTGIPGFPARAAWAKGERGHKSGRTSGDYPAQWHDTADGKFEWKGDTSSDELCSHFYSVSLFLELAAQGDVIARAREHLTRIAAHLIDHGWQLVDVYGKPTRWGRWDPAYLATDEGHFDRGLQSLELLSFIKTAATLSGEPKFDAAYKQLVDLGYPGHTLRHRQTFPSQNILHFLDELAFWSYWNLLRNEKDPRLHALYRRSFERTWEILRIEQNPWFNFVYGALTGNDCETGPAAAHLRDWPLDLTVWSYQNSQRADLRVPPGYTAYKAGVRPFPPRETEPMRWDHWDMQPDGGAGGRDVVEPSGWLLAYWMGRYYGFIEAPTVADPALITYPATHGPPRGARPYSGPARPN